MHPLLTQFYRHRKSLLAFFLLGGCVLFLSGCGFKWPEWANIDSDPFAFGNEERPDGPPPPSVIPKDEPDQMDPEFKFKPASTMGVNLETYFAQDIKDPVTRIERLENVILAMHKDMQGFANISPPRKSVEYVSTGAPQSLTPSGNAVMPQAAAAPGAMMQGGAVPMMVPEDEEGLRMQAQQQALLARSYPAVIPQNVQIPDTVMEPVRSAYAVGASPPARQQTSAPAMPNAGAAGTANMVTGIRVGEHPDKVRIVFDVSGTAAYTADLDNGEKILVVDMPESGWQAPSTAQYSKKSLLSSYRIDPAQNGRGNIAVFQLKRNSRIIKQQQIPALSGGGSRIFIDLSK